MPEIRGLGLDRAGRCEHYHSELDIVALRCQACPDYFACYQCHDALADHPFRPISQSEPDLVLCGHCQTSLDWSAYQSGFCPVCFSGFNPKCQTHHAIYFK